MKKTLLKKGMSLLLTLAMLCGLMAPTAFAAEEHTYSDTHGNWAETAIERWSDYGILQGNNGKFNPGGQLTRAHMAAILSRLLVLPEAEDAGFKDVKAGAWYEDYINRCAEAGIMLGSDGYANPDAPITRQQAVVMLARALGIKASSNPDLSAYSDAAQVSDYAAGYMAALAQAGIVKGTSETTLSPYANITRAATVTILDRAIEVYANEEGMDVQAEGTGLVLVVADKVDVTAPKGTTVVVAEGVQKTTVNGKLVSGGKTVTASAPSSGGGSSSRPSTPVAPEADNLTITESLTVSGGEQTQVYKNVTITDAVGNGEVTLENLTIYGDLTIQGGGSHTIHLVNCTVHGKVIMDKTQDSEDAEAPRLHLTNTPAPEVEAKQPAIIEAGDEQSKIGKLSAEEDVTIKGEKTKVETVTVPTDAKAPEVTVAGGAAVEHVVVQSPAVVAPTSDSKVSTVKAEAAVTVASGSVESVEVPVGKTAEVTVGEHAAVKEVAAKGQTTVKAEGKVETVVATAPVTVESGSVATVEVPSAATATVTVADKASVDKVDAKGATTIAAQGEGQVIAVNAQANVTVASGNVETITVPENAGQVEVAVSATAVVKDVAVNQATGTTIKVEGDVPPPVSSTLPDVAVTVKDKENNVAPPPHVHMWEKDSSHEANEEATCDHPGKLHHSCNKPGCPGGTKEETIPAKGHNWTLDPNHPDNKAPTCTEAGVRVYTCEHQNTHIKTESIPATSHSWGAWTKADDTNHQRVCANVNCPVKTESAAHKFDAGVVISAATCTTAGVKTFTCSVCSGTKNEEIAMLGHSYDTDGKFDGKDATGHWYVCNRGCGEKNVIAHTVVVDTAKDATCEATGLTDGAHCGDCAYVIVAQETLEKLGHNFNVAYSKDESGHWHKCSRCDVTDTKATHQFNTNNCAEKATCTVCQYEKAAGKHSWNGGVVTTQPTCTAAGVKTFTCSVCSATKTEEIAMLGHDYDTDGKFDGKDATGHWYVCNRGCGEKNVIAHTVVVDAAKEATCEAAGLTEGSHCGDCAYVIVAQKTIDALNHKWTAWTKYDEKTHIRTCANDAAHTQSKEHVYGGDFTCDDCGYGQGLTYPVYIRHLQDELTWVDEALEIVDGKLQLTIPGYGTAKVGETIPVVQRDGWTFQSWNIIIFGNDNEAYYYTDKFTQVTADLEKELLAAIQNERIIYLDGTVDIEGMGNNGFDLTLDTSDGEMEFTLSVPANADDEYFVNIISFDRANSYYTSVKKDDNYTGKVWAMLDDLLGVYGAVEVMDVQGNLLATFFAERFEFIPDGIPANMVDPSITINYKKSSANTIVYEITNPKGDPSFNYHLISPDNSSVYYLGRPDSNGKLYLYTDVQHELNSEVKVYPVIASTTPDGYHAMVVGGPVNVRVPAYDPNQNVGAKLEKILDEADDLGLLEYVDSSKFTAGEEITRLQAAMLAGVLAGVDPRDADPDQWYFKDGQNLTDEQKAVIMLLHAAEIMAPTAQDEFSPDSIMINAQVVTVLDRALGEPVVAPNYTYGPITDNHWAANSYAMMDSIGVLNQNIMDLSAVAAVEDVLDVFINAKNWLDKNTYPRYPATDLKVNYNDMRLEWTAPQLSNGLDPAKVRYVVTFDECDSNMNIMGTNRGGGTSNPFLALWVLENSQFDQVRVLTEYDGRICGSTKIAVSGEINEWTEAPARVQFTPNADKTAYEMTVTDLTPGEFFQVLLGTKPGNCKKMIKGEADQSGNYTRTLEVANNPDLADLVAQDCYFLVREYPNWHVTPDTIEMDIVNRGDWTRISDGMTLNSYKVSNIRFEDGYLRWDEPAIAATMQNVRYRVQLSVDGGQSWKFGCRSGANEIALMSFEEAVYNLVEISVLIDDISVSTEQKAIDLTVVENPVGTAPTVNFEKKFYQNNGGTWYTYEMIATGLKPNTMYIFDIQSRYGGSWWAVMSDATGKAIVEFHDDPEHVESGEYSIRELENCTITTPTKATVSWLYRGNVEKCFPATNTAWFEEYDSFLLFNWDMEEPADFNDYNNLRVSFYNEDEDEWFDSWWGDPNRSDIPMIYAGLEAGEYTDVNVWLVCEERVNGNWTVTKEKLWFSRSIELVIHEGSGTPQPQVTAKGNSLYDVTVSALSGRPGIVMVRNSERADGYGENWDRWFATKGASSVSTSADWWTLEHGYIMATEMYEVTVASDLKVTYTVASSDWEQCFDCGHTDTDMADYRVKNIRLDGSRIVWDEPTVKNPAYGYAVKVSQDGGQTWTEESFYGENQTLMHSMHFKAGVYDTIQITTYVPEACCERAVGSVTETIDLTVIEQTAATNASVVFTPVAGKTDTYSIVVDGLTPDNWGDLQLALKIGSEYDGCGSYGTPNADGSGRAVRDEINSYWPDQYSMEKLLTDGYYDLYEFNVQISNNGESVILTRISHGGWTKSVIGAKTYSDTAWFEIMGDGSLYFCWDMTPMANPADGYGIYLNNGSVWERVDGVNSSKNLWCVTSPGIEPGIYTGIRLVGHDSNGNETTTWFEKTCSLIVNQGPVSTPYVTFDPKANGNYDVEISGMAGDAEVAELIVSDHQGLGDIDYKCDDLGGYQQTMFEDMKIRYPNGYYRIREYSGLQAMALAASFTISESAWTQLNLGGVSGGGSSSANPADYEVANIRFANRGDVVVLEWDPAVTTDNIQYVIYAKNAATGDWEELARTTGTTTSIPAPHMDGTYNKIKIETILRSDKSVQASVKEDLNLTVTQKKAATNAVLSITPDPDGGNDAYIVNITGLKPYGRYVVCLWDADSRGQGSFGGTADENGNVVNGKTQHSGVTTMLDGGSYQVVAFSDYVLAADSKGLSCSVEKGEKVFLAGNSGNASGNRVWFENDSGELMLFWDGKEPADIGNYNRYQVYLHEADADEWRLLDILDMDEDRVNLLGNVDRIGAGYYDKARLELANVGQWAQPDGTAKEWFTVNINLTLEEIPQAPSLVQIEELANGEYKLYIENLWGQADSLLEIQVGMNNGNEEDSDMYPTNGYGMMTITTNWDAVPGGYYYLREWVDVQANDANGCLRWRAGQWTQFPNVSTTAA